MHYSPKMHAEESLNLAIQVFTLATENDTSPGSRAITALSLFKDKDARVVGTALQFVAAVLTKFITVEQLIPLKDEILEELANQTDG